MDILPVLILNARPAAGKSEIIDYLHSVSDQVRKDRFHLGKIDEIDDFPMLWTWFEEDAILTEMGQPRLHTDKDGFFLFTDLWNLLIRRICQEYGKKLRDRPDLHTDTTVIIEFSRGAEHGGYEDAFSHMTGEILKKAAALYVDVTYEESKRKNTRRFNPEKPDSVLEHGLPADKMEILYKDIDWKDFSSKSPEFLQIDNNAVPYAVLDNSDDITTIGGDRLGERLEIAMNTIWNLSGRGNL
ncbi:MAG: hypothetical protein HN368_08280 [Spirochaetales bacterium]|jgi:hypothetical protein|nr:hypothetical protein [Spirochaetales bacterium]